MTKHDVTKDPFVRVLVLQDRMLSFEDAADLKDLFEFYKDENGEISSSHAYCLLQRVGLKLVDFNENGLVNSFGTRVHKLSEQNFLLLVASLFRAEVGSVSAATAAEEDILLENLKYKRLFHSISSTTNKGTTEQYVSEEDLEAFLRWDGRGTIRKVDNVLAWGESICNPKSIYDREDDSTVLIAEDDFVNYIRVIPRKKSNNED